MEKNLKENRHIHITESPCCTFETNTTLEMNYTSTFLNKMIKLHGSQRAFKCIIPLSPSHKEPQVWKPKLKPRTGLSELPFAGKYNA